MLALLFSLSLILTVVPYSWGQGVASAVDCPISKWVPASKSEGHLPFNIRFSCKGKVDGLYADRDYDCKLYHLCTSSRTSGNYWKYTQYARVCPSNWVFDQQYQKCVEPSQVVTKCEVCEMYYPTAVSTTQLMLPAEGQLVPVSCPTKASGQVPCEFKDDALVLKNCPEKPGAATVRVNTNTQTTHVFSGYPIQSVTRTVIRKNFVTVGQDQRLIQPTLSVVPQGPGEGHGYEHVKVTGQRSGAQRPQGASGESAESDYLGLPLGSTKELDGNIDTTFDCTGKPYGYYADTKNGCKVYHVCSPKVDEFGYKFYEHFSFLCNLGTRFDQKTLTCVKPEDMLAPCHQAEKHFVASAQRFAPPPVDQQTPPKQPGQVVTVVETKWYEGGDCPVGYRCPVQSSKPVRGNNVQGIEHRPTINQRVAQPSGQSSISHEPSISQTIGQPSVVRSIAHNPRISQAVDQPSGQSSISHVPVIDQTIAQPSVVRTIEHNPRISQAVGQPSGQSSISHDPSISQTIGQPSAFRSIVHNPRISQGVALPSSEASISHRPSISQTIGQTGPGDYVQSLSRSGQPAQGDGQSSISHQPSITQTIVRSSYNRPSRREY